MKIHLLKLLEASELPLLNGDEITQFWPDFPDESRLRLMLGDDMDAYFPIDTEIEIDDDGHVHPLECAGQTYEFSFYVLTPLLPAGLTPE